MRTSLLLTGWLLLSIASAATAREWSDASGKFKIEAEFVAVRNGKVVLEKADGTLFSIALDKLSKADQEFVKSNTQPKEDSPFKSVDPKEKAASSADRTKLVKIEVRASQEGKPGEVRRFPEQSWGIASLAFSPNGGMLAAGKNDRGLLLLDVNAEERLDWQDKLDFLGQKISACLFTPDGSKLFAAGDKGTIQIYEVSEQGRLKRKHQFAGHSGGVICMGVSADSKTAVSGGEDKTLKVWKVEDGKEIASFDGFEGKVKACYMAADGKTAFATDGALLLAIDATKHEVVGRAKLTGSWAAGQCAAFSPDGQWVVAGDTYKLRVWDLNSGKEQKPLQSTEIQWSCAFTPDSTRVISGETAKINVWDIKKQTKINTLPTAGSYYVQCLATSPDNLHAAAIPGSAGQTLQVFRLPDVDSQ